MQLSTLSQSDYTSDNAPAAIDVSVVLPIYNEEESLPELVSAIVAAMGSTLYSYEIVCIDDGSSDYSKRVLHQLASIYPHLRAVIFRRNYGQTSAMAAGFAYAVGQVVVSLDADLQNDPADIPMLLDKLNEGYDLVSGWRQKRQDAALTRLLPSKIANWLIGGVTGVDLHDYGCSLKAYRADLVSDLNLYGELHRFLPALAAIEGAKIAEVPVRHHARTYGKSKYGLGRTFRVLMDLVTVWFMKTFLTRPMHVFGLWGGVSFLLGIALGIYLVIMKLGFGQEIGDRPLLVLVVILLLAGIQLFSFGLLGELLMRTYHESQGKTIYRVREVFGGKGKAQG